MNTLLVVQHSGNDKIMFLTEVGKYQIIPFFENRFFKSNFLNVFISQGLTNHFVLCRYSVYPSLFLKIHTRSINLIFIKYLCKVGYTTAFPFSIKLLIIINEIYNHIYIQTVLNILILHRRKVTKYNK